MNKSVHLIRHCTFFQVVKLDCLQPPYFISHFGFCSSFQRQPKTWRGIDTMVEMELTELHQ